MIATRPQKKSPDVFDRRVWIAPADLRGLLEKLEACGQLFGEKAGRCRSVFPPPGVNGPNLLFYFGRDEQAEGHFRRARSSSTMASARRPLPAFADSHALAMAALSA